MKLVKISSAILVFAAIVAGGPAAQAVCTKATLKGVYGIVSGGLDGTVHSAASLDQITSNVAGALTGSSS